ncbi:Zn-dependent alcohol dehydrogenase [Maritimibacter sp. DP1N21-5]|uniref:Zn-dependent alcohol dehydrogenase n=1 Tax=Maritimibacter sp. DP1N21-5 TaxID=2836867 RepID=UPI001C4730A5|nr:Zn-dependent alcohol dehydrogenase [Maritimibacter sp. DP1N21-5]MBV7408608.1 Zn-dependent alcohol dehydrogenase [Maritimibacter sp. DP1N21-5]
MDKIKAAVCHAFGEPLVIEEISIRPPEAGEVEVEIHAVAICQSDISFAEGGFGGPLPAVYGHEAAGIVSRVGPEVHGIAPGDRVVVTLIRACGHCPSCQTARPVTCETPYDGLDQGPLTTGDGAPVYQGLQTGAFAERVVVLASQVAKIPDTVPMDSAALLACGVITGIGAVVNVANIRPGQTVVVIGAGGVGLNAIQGARIAGAARIIAVDMTEEKLAMARDFGATHGVLASEEKPWSAMKKLNGGRGADAVFVTVGAAPVYDAAPRYLAPGGNVIMVGLPHATAKASYSPLGMGNAAQGILGTMMGNTVIARDIPWMVDLYEQKRLKLDELISNRFPLDQINEAIASTKSGSAKRNVIVLK